MGQDGSPGVQALGNPEATKLFHRTEMRIEALQAGAVTRAFDRTIQLAVTTAEV